MRGKKIREIKARVIAAVITVVFIAAVRPDPNPSLWGVALTALLIYEAISVSVMQIAKGSRVRKTRSAIEFNEAVRKREGEILDEMLFNPYREVS